MNEEEVNTHAAAGSAHARALLVFISGIVAFLTLRPFAVRIPVSLTAIADAAFSYDRETFQHVVPAALVVVLTRAGWRLGRYRAAVLCFIGLLGLEVAQAFMEYRHARLGDILAQIIGIAIGMRLPTPAISQRVWRSIWTSLLIGWVLMGIGVGIRGQFGHTLGPMATSHRLVVGDEHDGGRPWLGNIHSFSIGTERSSGPLVAFGQPPADNGWTSKADLPIQLRRAHAGWSSIDEVPALSKALDHSPAIVVAIDATPAETLQSGPARLVTLSKGMSHRNLTIGQQGDALVVRVRTPRSGRNAARPAFVFPAVFEANERVALRIWTDGGAARLWVNDAPTAKPTYEQVSYTTPRDWLGLVPGLGDMAGVVALFAPVGLLVGAVAFGGRCRSNRFLPAVWIAAVAVPIAMLSMIWTTSLMLDRPLTLWLLPSSIGLSIAGAAIASALRGRH